MKKIFLLSILSVGIFLTGWTQSSPNPVGIGTKNPDKTAVLELKSTNQGVLIPRLTTSQRDAIAGPALGLTIFNTDNNCIESWTGTDWVGNCGVSPAVAAIADCNSITVNGTYKQDQAIDPTANTLVLQLNVTKKGTYSIAAAPQNSNGYYFNASGTFSSTGAVTITLPGMGTPKNAANSDTILIQINGVTASCKIPITVASSAIPRNFTLNCSGITTSGIGVPNAALNGASNTISLSLTVQPGSMGAGYSITTNTNNGMTFGPSSGIIMSSPQPVTLAGSGTPVAGGVYTFNISSNSASSSATCPVNYTVTYPQMNIVGFSNGTYGYDGSNAGYSLTNGKPNALSAAMLATGANFGTLSNSKVPYNGTLAVTQVTTSESAGQIATYLSTTTPDILIISYNSDINTADATAINTYLTTQKGVVLFFNERNVSQTGADYIAKMLGYPAGSFTFLGNQLNYACPTLGVNDVITNGPFGNVSSTSYWLGQDGGGGNSLKFGSYAGNFTNYASWDGGTSANTFRHNTLNFIYVGDGGFLAGLQTDGGCSNNPGACPFAVDANFAPAIKTATGPTGSVQACNAALFGNMMAWAIKQATLNGRH